MGDQFAVDGVKKLADAVVDADKVELDKFNERVKNTFHSSEIPLYWFDYPRLID